MDVRDDARLLVELTSLRRTLLASNEPSPTAFAAQAMRDLEACGLGPVALAPDALQVVVGAAPASAEVTLALAEVRDVIALGLRARRAETTASDADDRGFRALYEDAAVGIALMGTRGQFVRANRRMCELLGYTEAELQARGYHDVTAPEYAAADAALHREMREGGRTEAVIEKELIRKDGARVWQRITIALVRDGHVPPRFVAIAEDISAAKRAEAAMAASEARLRLFVEHAPAAIALLDRELRYLEVSRRFITDYQLADQPLRGRRHYDVFPELPARWREIHQRCLAGAVEGHPGEAFIRGDGHTDWVRWEVRPWHDASGAVGGLVLFSEVLTERAQMAQALDDSEARFRAVFEQAGIGMALVDPNGGRFLAANDAVCATFGYPREVLLGMTWRDVTPPEDLAFNEAFLAPLYASQVRTLTHEKRYRHGSGRPLWGRLTLTRLDEPHRPVRLLAMVEDITERRAAVEAVQASEERLASMFALAPIGIAEGDLVTRRLTRVNSQLCAITGYSAAELCALSVRDDLTHPDDRAGVEAAVRELRAGQLAVHRGQRRYRHKDGHTVWVDVALTLIRDADGTLTRTLATIQDVTAQHAAERALRDSEARYRTLVDSLDDVVFTLDADLRVTFVNRAVSIFGFAPEALLGQPALDRLAPADHLAALELVTAGADLPPRELRVLDAAGRLRPVRVLVRPTRLGDRVTGVTGVVVDLTAHRETEEQLRAAQKMEAVGRLAGGVAHDFNNLLSVILSYTDLAVADLHAEDPLRADLKEVQAAARRAEGLTRQLLAFSRKQVLSPQLTDLHELVGGLARMLRRLIGEDVELVIADAHPDAQALIDRGQLEQVIMNLVVNARDAMPDGGRVTIATTAVELDAPTAHALALAPGPYLELTVADDGVGMDEAVRARVFEPFFTTKGVGKGTGLGLAMVYGMVRQSGGAVAVDSAPGHGARFHIYLPAHAADDTAEPTRPISVVARGSGAVLVIEDEPALRNVIRRVLTAAGYQVAVAADASEARLLAARLGERLRLVLSDVILPGANGPTIVAELRQAVPDLAVIFMSGYTDDALARFGMAERDFLRKPFDLKLLTARVRQALDAVQPRRP